MTRRTELGELEQAVLLAIWHGGGEAWALDVRDEIVERTGRRLSVSATHATLSRLEDKGHVRSWMADPEPVPGGRSRRRFALETRGREALQRAHRRLRRLWDGYSGEAPLPPSPESSR